MHQQCPRGDPALRLYRCGASSAFWCECRRSWDPDRIHGKRDLLPGLRWDSGSKVRNVHDGIHPLQSHISHNYVRGGVDAALSVKNSVLAHSRTTRSPVAIYVFARVRIIGTLMPSGYVFNQSTQHVCGWLNHYVCNRISYCDIECNTFSLCDIVQDFSILDNIFLQILR